MATGHEPLDLPEDPATRAGRCFYSLGRGRLLRGLLPALLRRPGQPGGWLLLAGLLAPRRYSGPVLKKAAERFYIPGMSRSWRFRERMPPSPLKADIVAVVTTVGEPTTEECVELVRRQTLSPRRVEVVRDAAPISAACNLALDLAAGAEFLSIVDADMALDPDCFDRLTRILRAEPKALAAAGYLRDPFLGTVGHIKLYRMAALEGLRFEDVPACDARLYAQAEAKGWRFAATPETLGAHRSDISPQRAFNSFRRLGQKWARRMVDAGRNEPADALARLSRAYLERRDPVSMAALVGLCHGLFQRDESEKDFRRYGEDDWPAMEELIRRPEAFGSDAAPEGERP